MKVGRAVLMALLFSVNLLASSQIVTSDITSNTLWNADTVYIDKSGFSVQSGVRLTIAPGTVVRFRGGLRFITVKGTITAIGTVSDSISFAHENSQIVWQGIRLLKRNRTAGKDSSFFSYCKLAGAQCINTDSAYMVRGGALYCGPGNYVGLSRSNLQSNVGSHGGAIYADSGSDVRIEDCYFKSNTAEFFGGGAIMTNSGGPINLAVNSCRFDYNYARNGGAIRVGKGTSAEINSCIFYRDSTLSINPALHDLQGGALAVFGPSDVVVKNSIFLFCRSYDKGGAIYSSDAALKLINCTVAQSTALYGGGIYFAHTSEPSFPQLVNTIVSHNGVLWGIDLPRDSAGVAIYLDSAVSPSFRNCAISDTVYDHTIKPFNGNFENSAYRVTSWAWEMRIDLSDTLVEGYNLDEYDKSIDAGTPDVSGFGLSEYDLAGKTRISGSAIDIGAFEYNGPVSISGYNPQIKESQLFGCSELVVYSLDGKRITMFKGTQIPESVRDLRKKLPRGVYLLTASRSGKKLGSRKFFVK